jgi:hypothetical protein
MPVNKCAKCGKREKTDDLDGNDQGRLILG